MSQLLSDLVKMYPDAPPQLGARVTTNPTELERWAYRDTHGMFPEEAEALAERRRQNAFIERHTADIDRDLVTINGTSDTARHKHSMFVCILDRERTALKNLESRREQFTEYVNAPAKTQGKIQAAIAATARWLMGGDGDEPSVDRAALDAELAAATHKAQAAGAVIADIDKQIGIAKLRVDHVSQQEREFLHAAMREIVEQSGLLQLLARRRAETAALERLLSPTSDYGGYGRTINVPAERHEIKWRSSWREIANTIRETPDADVSKMLPKVPS